MDRGAIWIIYAVLLVGCFADTDPVESTTGSSGGTSSTVAGTTSGSSGSASGDSASGSATGGSTGTGSTGSGSTGPSGSTGAGGPLYGPCNMLGTCDDPVEQCLHPSGNTDVCGAPCETKADCPPPPPRQAAVCLDLFPEEGEIGRAHV